MKQTFQEQHAASLRRIVSGADVLVANVTVEDEVLTVRPDQVGQAMFTLHGAPTLGLIVSVKIEYAAMSATDFASLPDWQ
jgi:hypothetical protein